MKIHTLGATCRLTAALAILAIAVAAVTLLPAGIGNLGRAGTTAGGSVLASGKESASLAGTSQISVTVHPPCDPPVVASRTLNMGDSIPAAVALLVGDVNADAEFQATSVNDPDDPTANSFRVLQESGIETERLKICENDLNIDNVGVAFASGMEVAFLNKVASVAANGNYVVSIRSQIAGSFSQTFNTALAANDTAAELNANIAATLSGAGYLVQDDGVNFVIRRPADKLTALRVSATDTNVAIFCVELTTNELASPAAVPTLSQWAMFLMILLMTGASFVMLRRRMA